MHNKIPFLVLDSENIGQVILSDIFKELKINTNIKQNTFCILPSINHGRSVAIFVDKYKWILIKGAGWNYGGPLVYKCKKDSELIFGLCGKKDALREISVSKKISEFSDEFPIVFDYKLLRDYLKSDEYSFFMDSGYLEDGTKVHGKYGKAISYDDALTNTKGCINIASSLESDFYLFQEIDLDSDRCYHINQNDYILEEFTTFDSTFAINFHSAYLFYPFNDPHGKTTAGLSTLSSYKIESATRKRYSISDGFDKYLDLDRCFSVNRINTDNDKELVLINSHMSAYDEGGVIRNKQLNELNSFMLEEVNKGNYVVCGGDFNHDLLSNNPLYPQFNKENFPFKEMIKQPKPDWINYMFSEDGETILDDEFSVYGGANEPSCRGCEIPWTRGYNFVTPVDGFITSSNVEVVDVVTTKVGENGFEFSDHQPVTLSFKLL